MYDLSPIPTKKLQVHLSVVVRDTSLEHVGRPQVGMQIVHFTKHLKRKGLLLYLFHTKTGGLLF